MNTNYRLAVQTHVCTYAREDDFSAQLVELSRILRTTPYRWERESGLEQVCKAIERGLGCDVDRALMWEAAREMMRELLAHPDMQTLYGREVYEERVA